ncbi:MAG: PDZ domain-containing protein, partial [Verrucomicrobiales bacterium]|nr:PDZ domain-containing protein [Verrucomicrobiales bacterium]
VDLRASVVEVVRLRHLVTLEGTRAAPVRWVRIAGLTFRHAARTFMDNREPLLRSDWTTYRGGAVVFRGAEDCTVSDSTFDQVGGNAVFVDGYNRRVWIRGCEITGAGANGVAFVGRPEAVRSPLFEYEQRQGLAQIDRTPGPKSDAFPSDCGVEDCLITRSGRFEKQTAPVQIAMAQAITVRHCSIYDVPRAGINIGDGCWGGHLVEHCDIFDTVLETGDHGSFNSWGRDRFWGLTGVDLDTVTQGELRELPKLDMERPTVLRNNRWRCDHGWDIDLDDGSSNYEIRNNLCLNGGIKLREGFYRVCENNVMVNNSFHPHVWYRLSEDVFRRNIVFTPYRPIRVPTPWGRECESNLLHRPGQELVTPATNLVAQSGRDANSVQGDARFLDPTRGDYRVKEGSPALALGFVNFDMDRFGVRSERLRARARTPKLPGTENVAAVPGGSPRWTWRGATLKELEGAEFSVVGVAATAGGVLVVEVKPGSEAERAGFQRMDLIRTVDGSAIADVGALARALRVEGQGAQAAVGVRRNQFETTLSVARGGTESIPARIGTRDR